MAAANNEFFEALSMLEHERGITAEYLIEKIKAAIVIAVKKNYEVEDDNVMVEIDPATGKFNVALLQNVVADEDWYDEHAEIGLTEAQKLRKSYEIGDRVLLYLKWRKEDGLPSPVKFRYGELAEYLGVNRTALYRAIAKLRKANKVRIEDDTLALA